MAAILAVFTNVMFAGNNYKSYRVSLYVKANEVAKMADPAWLESTWKTISDQMDVDRVYLETHRDMNIIPQSTLDDTECVAKSFPEFLDIF